MTLEKRKFERSDIFLIVEFRQFNKTCEYSLGVMKNFSHEGFTIESQRYDLKPGEILELKLKHPRRDLSVSASGEIVWKKEAWYKCMMGIKFKEMDKETERKILELISKDRDMPIDSLLHDKIEKAVMRDEEEKESAEQLNAEQKEGLMTEAIQKDDKDMSEHSEISNKEEVSVDEVLDETETAERVEEKNTVYEQKSNVNIEELQKKEMKQDMGQTVSNNISLIVKSRRKKSRAYMPLVAVLMVISVVVLLIRYENIKNGFINFIPTTKSIFSLDSYKRQLMSFFDDTRPNSMTVKELSEAQQEHDTHEINNRLSKEEKTTHLKQPVTTATTDQDTNDYTNNKEPLVVAKDAQSKSLAINEGNLIAASLKGDITFDTNSDVVNPALYSDIDRIVNVLLRYPQTVIRVEGHTDSTGSESYNMDLSARRATAVKNLLIHRGIVSSRIETMGFGNSSPVASNDTKTGRMRNRRVEIKIVPSNY